MKPINNLIFKKDVIIVTGGIFLGIEEFIENKGSYNYSAVVVSDKAKVYEVSLKVY